MASELKNKTINGIGWGFIDNLMNIGLMAIFNIILARLLTDDDFGLLGLTTIFITLATSLVDSGFSSALTRKKYVNDKDYNTVFYFNLSVSILLYLILFFLAPLISSFFNQPILIPIIRILSSTLIINAFSIVQKTILIRKIDFKTQAIISAVSSVVSGVIGIIMAFNGYGVWSLVVLQVVRVFISSVLLCFLGKWLPSLTFSISSFKEMFSFGGKLLLTSLIETVYNEIYSLIIGKVYSPGLLGQYYKANKFANMFTSNVSIVMQRVSYPVLSTIQDEHERQLRAYRKVLKTTVLISFTCVLGLAAISESFILVLIGEQWVTAIKFLRILCLSGIFTPIIFCSTNIINANGHSNLTLRLEIIKTLLTIIPIILGIYFSIEALLWGMVAISFIIFLIYAGYVSKVINYKISLQIKDIFPYFIIAAVMAALVFPISFIHIPQIAILFIQIFLGVFIIVFIFEFIYKSEEYFEIKSEFIRIFNKIFKKNISSKS